MRGLMWVLAVFALAVGLSLAAHLNNGYAILVFPPYRAELSLNFAILLGLAGFTLGYLLLRLVVHTLRLPLHVRNFRARRRDAKGRAARAAVRMRARPGLRCRRACCSTIAAITMRSAYCASCPQAEASALPRSAC